MQRAVMAVALGALGVAGCGGAETPSHLAHDVAAIRVGVDPAREADHAAAGLEEAGYVVRTRIEGRSFSAFDAQHPDGRSVVRIVTRRGIAGAVDVDAPGELEERVALRETAGAHGYDLDGDGDEEVIVAQRDPALGRDCLAMLRVLEDGAVVAVPVDLEALGEAACVERVTDVGGDARPELLSVVRALALSRGRVPTVVVPLSPQGGGYRPAPAAHYRAYWERQRREREEVLSEAREDRDVETAYRLAVEMALIERQTGRGAAAWLRAFDAAMRGLVLTEAQARGVAVARERVEEWGVGVGGEGVVRAGGRGEEEEEE